MELFGVTYILLTEKEAQAALNSLYSVRDTIIEALGTLEEAAVKTPEKTTRKKYKTGYNIVCKYCSKGTRVPSKLQRYCDEKCRNRETYRKAKEAKEKKKVTRTDGLLQSGNQLLPPAIEFFSKPK